MESIIFHIRISNCQQSTTLRPKSRHRCRLSGIGTRPFVCRESISPKNRGQCTRPITTIITITSSSFNRLDATKACRVPLCSRPSRNRPQRRRPIRFPAAAAVVSARRRPPLSRPIRICLWVDKIDKIQTLVTVHKSCGVPSVAPLSSSNRMNHDSIDRPAAV